MSNGVNPTRDLRLFQSIAARQGDRMIFGGTQHPESLRHVRNNAFGRAATWVRKSLGTAHESSVDEAYTRFSGALQSIRTDASAQELARVDAQLETDRRAGKPLSSRRVGQVLSQLGTQVARGVTGGAPPADPSRARYQMLAEAARKGIDAARANLAEASGDLVDADECLSKLRSGDGGLRRGTTALSNLQHHLKPETLAPNTLHRERPRSGSCRRHVITGMAGQLANASFSDSLDANFLQYGNSDNPFSNVADHFRDLDRPVRSWLAEGLELADALLRRARGGWRGEASAKSRCARRIAAAGGCIRGQCGAPGFPERELVRRGPGRCLRRKPGTEHRWRRPCDGAVDRAISYRRAVGGQLRSRRRHRQAGSGNRAAEAGSRPAFSGWRRARGHEQGACRVRCAGAVS